MRRNVILVLVAIAISIVNSPAQERTVNKEPFLKIGNYVFDTLKKIPLKETLKFEKLEVTDLNYSVVSYEISFISSDSLLYVRTVNNNEISDETKDRLKNLEPGNRIFFDSVKVKDKSGKLRFIRSAIIKLKEEAKLKEPVLKIGKYEVAKGNSTIEIPLRDFLLADGLTTNDTDYTVVSFDLTFQINNVVKMINNESAKFSKSAKESFLKIKPVVKINVENIKIKHEDGTRGGLPPVDIIVKENPVYRDPFIKIGNYVFEASKEVPIKDIITFEKVETDNPDFTIVSYNLSVFIDGLMYEVTSNNDKIPEIIKQKLPKIKPGGNIVIENIKVKNNDGKIVNLPSVVIKAKK